MTHLISLMGIDGSGKTSLAEQLQVHFSKQGEKSVVVWAVLRPIILKPLISISKFLFVRKYNKFLNYNSHIKAKRKGMSRFSWAHRIYFVVMLVDYMPQVIYKVWWQRLLGKHVICDRYYHDLMLDYGVNVNANSKQIIRLVRFAEKIFPIPDYFYFISTPPELAFSRKKDIPAIEYLIKRDNLYQAIAYDLNARILDGRLTLEENCRRVLFDLGS